MDDGLIIGAPVRLRRPRIRRVNPKPGRGKVGVIVGRVEEVQSFYVLWNNGLVGLISLDGVEAL